MSLWIQDQQSFFWDNWSNSSSVFLVLALVIPLIVVHSAWIVVEQNSVNFSLDQLNGRES